MEEARAYLQTRLELFSKLMFAAFVTLLVFLAGMYLRYPEISPKKNDQIFIGAAIGLLAMGGVWRLLLVRKKLSLEALNRVDLVYAIFIGLAFGGSAWFAYDFRPA